jgi:hypothetical protein
MDLRICSAILQEVQCIHSMVHRELLNFYDKITKI